MVLDKSLAERLDPEAKRKLIASLSTDEAAVLLYEWERFWSRPKQRAPSGDWNTWLLLCGRGFGKTRTGAEFVRSEVEAGRAKRIALVGPTAADVRDTMIEGESGILSISPPWCRPSYEPSKRRLTWPNGTVALCFSADEPDRLRGPQHDLAWVDELAAYRRAWAVWDQLQFGLRLGTHPRAVVTTTPRPIGIIKSLIAASKDDGTVVVTPGSTFENSANLADSFKTAVLSNYEGTRLGRQELFGEILDDVPGALWTRTLLDGVLVREVPQLRRIVVAVDPSVAGHDEKKERDEEDRGDECGIVVAGVGLCACKGKPEEHGFVLADYSARMSPGDWAVAVADAYKTHSADRVVAESNQGGALVTANLRTVEQHLPVSLVRATQGKRTRAEPVASLYERKLIHHLPKLGRLEDQLCSWDGTGKSPDRLDALVWALTELMLDTPTPASYEPIKIASRWQ